MSTTSIYVNFPGNTEEAFMFYKSVFGTEFDGDIMRMREVPPDPSYQLSEKEKNLVLHISMPILGGTRLMGTDATDSMGQKLTQGNNVYINLEPDTRKETERLFNALKKDGIVEMELQEMFWGDYFGSIKDQFGICWMFNCSEKSK